MLHLMRLILVLMLPVLPLLERVVVGTSVPGPWSNLLDKTRATW